ncbi:hypothetical protein KSP40_PGU003143 [Platanthera guangdongensis]|uniref:Uncharacterized protein n=1 Tax=Platanthera guangdongensis TaxID=2320717 RepID=A0ABR2LDE3_9ASPA
MNLKGRGRGVDLGTLILSLIRSIFFSFFGLELPNDPLKRFPRFVFLSPRPQVICSIAVCSSCSQSQYAAIKDFGSMSLGRKMFWSAEWSMRGFREEDDRCGVASNCGSGGTEKNSR